MKILSLPLRCASQIWNEKRQQKMLSKDEGQNIASINSWDRMIALKDWEGQASCEQAGRQA